MSAAAAPSEVVRRGPVSTVLRGPGASFTKRYDVLWPWVPLLGLLKANLPCLSAERELRNARAVAALGVGAPEARLEGPPAWRLDLARLGVRRASALRLAALPGEPLDRLLADDRLPEAARRHVARALGRAVGALHAAGRFHRDLYLCHVLVDPQARSLGLIDLARADRRLVLRGRARVKDLAALLYSSRGLVRRAERARFLRAYLGPHPERAASRVLLARVAGKAASLARHGRKG